MKKSRKILGVIDGLVAVVAYVTTFFALNLGPEELLAVRDGQRDGKPILLALAMLVLAVPLFLAGRQFFGDGGHKRSRNAVAVALAALPLEKLLLFGLRWYVVCASDLSGKIVDIFVRNSGVLEGILIAGTLAGGLLAAAFRRASEYGDKTPNQEESRIKSGLLGMLGAAGYDICDVILTSYDGVKTAILVFDTDEAWKIAVERGIDQEIVAACKKVEPEYEYTFEAKA